MYSIESLISLVASMSQSEKRYFRLEANTQKGEKDYVKLFNLLEENTSNPAVLLEKLLPGSFPGNSVEPARKHLSHVLMKSLRLYEGNSRIENRLVQLLQDSRILYTKGLHEEAMRQLEKGKELAERHEKHLYYILLAKEEMQFLVASNFSTVTEEELIDRHEHVRVFLQHETSLHDYSTLYHILLHRYWRNGQVRSEDDIKKLNDLLLEEYQTINSQVLKSFEVRQLHLQFQGVYMMMTGNFAGSIEIFHQIDQLFQQNRADSRPLYYVYLLNAVLMDLRFMEQYDEIAFFIDRLSSVADYAPDIRPIVECMVYEHQLQVAVDRKDSPTALKLAQDYAGSNGLHRNHLPFANRLQLQYCVSRAFFFCGEYGMAQKLLYPIINYPPGIVYQPLYVTCALMNLQIHALQRNNDHLSYILRNLERRLKKERKLFRTEQFIFSFIKRWLNMKTGTKDMATLTELENDPFERHIARELNLRGWTALMAHGRVS